MTNAREVDQYIAYALLSLRFTTEMSSIATITQVVSQTFPSPLWMPAGTCSSAHPMPHSLPHQKHHQCAPDTTWAPGRIPVKRIHLPKWFQVNRKVIRRQTDRLVLAGEIPYVGAHCGLVVHQIDCDVYCQEHTFALGEHLNFSKVFHIQPAFWSVRSLTPPLV